MSAGQCAICLKTDAVTREHVWPRWFLDRMDEAGAPPYGWSINGKPVLDRRGNQIKGDKRQRVMIGVCASCNGTMNTSIEVPAKPIVEQLALNGWRGTYDGEQWRAVGLWWAKVLLLVGHPKSSLENARLQRFVELDFDSEPDVRWLTSGSPVPQHVSVFVHNADYSRADTDHLLTLPARVLFETKKSADCHVMSLATPGMAVTVACHPGIRIEHPLVASGDAWELLHSPPSRGDIGKLQPLPWDNVRYLRGASVPEGHVADGSEASRLVGLVGYQTGDIAGSTDPGGSGPDSVG